jgi:hypothetical protein
MHHLKIKLLLTLSSFILIDPIENLNVHYCHIIENLRLPIIVD